MHELEWTPTEDEIRDRMHAICRTGRSIGRNEVVHELRANRYRDALRYIAGFDIAGYESHLLSDEVAAKALGEADA